MQFVDYVKIKVKAGDGGRGCISFRREKYVPRGGPDGGDGGRGGHIIVRAKDELNTLLDQKYQREYKAERGQHGMGKKMHGKDGEDLIISVPVGTVMKEAETNDQLIDLDKNRMETIIAKGGRGGLGNAHFATPTRQAPRYAQPGEKGEEKSLPCGENQCFGTQSGYDLELLKSVSERIKIPLIASGGAGSPAHLLEGLREGCADAVLAASIFHYDQYSITEVKQYLSRRGITMRL